MKIKPTPKKKTPWWLLDSIVKPTARLPQLNKHGRRKIKSEFVTMAEQLETQPNKDLFARR